MYISYSINKLSCITIMTSKKRLLLLSIFISVFGFAFLSAVNPPQQKVGIPKFIVASESKSKSSVLVSKENYIDDYNFDVDRQYSRFDPSKSRMVNMLSITLDMPTDDVQEILDGGVKPSEMLANSGILLSDLAEDFNFEIVGDRGLVRFLA